MFRLQNWEPRDEDRRRACEAIYNEEELGVGMDDGGVWTGWAFALRVWDPGLTRGFRPGAERERESGRVGSAAAKREVRKE